MKLIDILREKYNSTLFKADDAWYYVQQIYSDYVDVIEYHNSYTQAKTLTWIDFFQIVEPEEDTKKINKIMPFINDYFVKKAKEQLS